MTSQTLPPADESVEFRKEALVMALYVAVCLLAALSALGESSDDGHVRALALVWGTTIGLAAAHILAFRVLARLIAHGELQDADRTVVLAQIIGAAGVAGLAEHPERPLRNCSVRAMPCVGTTRFRQREPACRGSPLWLAPPASFSTELDEGDATMNDTIESTTGIEGLQLAREWPAVFLMGLFTIGLGIVVISWPQETLTVISVLIGLQILVYGVYRLITAFAHDTVSPGWTGFAGVFGIIVGIVVLRNPFETVAVLAVLLGVVWIIGGILEFVGSIADRGGDHRGLGMFGGVLSIVAGVVVVAWPAPTVTVVAWIAGLYLIVFGLFFVVSAVQLRSISK